MSEILGLDIGGSGIKGAPVDVASGSLLAERFRVATPSPANPKDVVEASLQVISQFNWKGPIGIGFPGVIKRGRTMTAANLTEEWIGFDAKKKFSKVTGCPVSLINDADAAGLAEATFGAGREGKGLTAMLTVGTGIGVALIINGQIVPNMELGHIRLENGKIGEKFAADSARKKNDLSWKDFGKRFSIYLEGFCKLINPDLIIIGGGLSKKFEKVQPYIDCDVEIVTAELLNHAGIIGAAIHASRTLD